MSTAAAIQRQQLLQMQASLAATGAAASASLALSAFAVTAPSLDPTGLEEGSSGVGGSYGNGSRAASGGFASGRPPPPTAPSSLPPRLPYSAAPPARAEPLPRPNEPSPAAGLFDASPPHASMAAASDGGLFGTGGGAPEATRSRWLGVSPSLEASLEASLRAQLSPELLYPLASFASRPSSGGALAAALPNPSELSPAAAPAPPTPATLPLFGGESSEEPAPAEGLAGVAAFYSPPFAGKRATSRLGHWLEPSPLTTPPHIVRRLSFSSDGAEESEASGAAALMFADAAPPLLSQSQHAGGASALPQAYGQLPVLQPSLLLQPLSDGSGVVDAALGGVCARGGIVDDATLRALQRIAMLSPRTP